MEYGVDCSSLDRQRDFYTSHYGILSIFVFYTIGRKCLCHQEEDESIRSFISRRFGQDIAEALIDPIISGIYGGNISKLSARSCLEVLWNAEKDYGSVVLAMMAGHSKRQNTLLDGSTKSTFIQKYEHALSVSFLDGMTTLVQSLVDNLQVRACQLRFLAVLDFSGHGSF